MAKTLEEIEAELKADGSTHTERRLLEIAREQAAELERLRGGIELAYNTLTDNGDMTEWTCHFCGSEAILPALRRLIGTKK